MLLASSWKRLPLHLYILLDVNSRIAILHPPLLTPGLAPEDQKEYYWPELHPLIEHRLIHIFYYY